VRDHSELGDCGRATVFQYRQEGSRVWATYEGDGVRFGSLVAVCDAEGSLHGCYQHLSSEHGLRIGCYVGVPELLLDSRVVIREHWRTQSGEGYSVLEQLDQPPAL